MPDPISISVFLSHSYNAGRINRFLYTIMSEIADVQFAVDQKDKDKPTSVTRLERLIRDADAFVGIYPMVGRKRRAGAAADTKKRLEIPETLAPGDRVSTEVAEAISAYFRLELDLAVRAGIPAFIFVDDRYKSVIEAPASVIRCDFDAGELLSQGRSPSRDRFKKAFTAFGKQVRGYKQQRAWRSSRRVGLLLPPEYKTAEIRAMKAQIERHSQEAVVLDWPLVLTGRTMRDLEDMDWMVVDIGSSSLDSGACGYLHGRFMPQVRLLRGGPKAVSPLEGTLYAKHTVGFPKDIVRWKTPKDLATEFEKRLDTLHSPSRQFRTVAEGQDYFSSAEQLSERVFLSYSGPDSDVGALLSKELKSRFEFVFDYKDGNQSIAGGQRWEKRIKEELPQCRIGVALISETYPNSPICMQEAETMSKLEKSQKMVITPLRLTKNAPQIHYFDGIYYISVYRLSEEELIVRMMDGIKRGLDALPPR